MAGISFNTDIISRSPSETEALAGRFYALLSRGDLVALYGPLGAGKTCFVRGVAKAAGVDSGKVTSPSFTLVNEYPGGEIPIYHFDLYRVADPSEFYTIGGDDYLKGDGIVLIEWAENGQGVIPERRYEVKLDIVDEQSRKIFITRVGV